MQNTCFDQSIGKTDQPFVLPYLSFGNEDEPVLLGRILPDQGYYETRLKVRRVDCSKAWHLVRAEVLPPVEAEDATGKVLVLPATAEFGVISDLDDTVLRKTSSAASSRS